jgi:hypothetical protein
VPFAVRPLPAPVAHLLEVVAAPPRLVAHLALVHDAAGQLTEGIDRLWPALAYDHQAVLIGAATHDIGKIVVREELTQPGTRHEEVGEGILLEHGFPPQQARFARTHGGPTREPSMRLEDWLVMLADHIWKGARRPLIEDNLRDLIAVQTHSPAWEVYLNLDDLLVQISAGADERLAWHGAQPA